jgi:hypothetical protein
MTERDGASELVTDLWDLVERWSSGAISLARAGSLPGSEELAEAEIRLLMEHATDLRGVIEAHLEHDSAELVAVAVAASVVEPRPEPSSRPGPGPVDATPEHRCDSADFERPVCAACGRHHWYCSVCGAQQDQCAQL